MMTIVDDGRDYIPRTIDSYHVCDDVDLYVCEDQHHERTCVSLLCGTRDGSLYRVWGARTHPSYRGRGIMTYMMGMIRNAVSLEDVDHIVSTTIATNTTMLNMFHTLEYSQHAVVYGWPDSTHDRTMNDVMNELTHCELHKMYTWKVCGHCSLLCDALSCIRKQPKGLDRLWLPGSYETASADGHMIQKMMDQRRVYIVSDVSDTPVAVVASMQDQLDREILSVVHNTDAHFHHILSEYASMHDTSKHMSRVYVDTCGAGQPHFSFPSHIHTETSSVLPQDAGWFDYIVLTQNPT